MAFAASLLALVAGGALAAEPSSIPPSGAPAVTDAPLPDLTMAPLVTLPPIRPSVLDEHDLTTDGYVLGRADAPVTIDVYEDFQCPYCQRFTLLESPQLVETWVRPGHARLVFHDFAFLGEESRWAAVAGRLAADQDRFWPFHDLLYSNLLGENVGSFTPDRLMLMARMAGLDMERFIEGLQVPAARAMWATIDQEVRDAAANRGVSGTPSIFVNGTRVAAADAPTVGAAIEAALSTTGTSGSPAPPVVTSPAASTMP